MAGTATAQRVPAWVQALVSGSVERDQLVAMMRATPWGWSMAALGVFILKDAFGQAHEPHAKAMAIWVPLIGAMVALRLLAWLVWLVRARHDEVTGTWACIILGSNLLAAATWGALCPLLGPAGAPAAEGILHVAFAAVAIGGTSRLAGFERVMVAFVLLLLGPLALRDFWTSSGYGVLTVVGGLYSVASGASISRALRELQAQRVRSAELAEQLREEVSRGEAARAQLEEAGRARTHIFAAANHDLRQPLHAMGLLVQALRSLPASDEVQAIAERLEDCTEGMGDVVDDLIELSRTYAEPRQPRLAPLALRPFVEDCCRPYAAIAAAKGLQLEVDMPEFGVLSDGAMLARIVGNLVSNAVRYTVRGGVRVHAERERTGAVYLHIQDTGIGIPAEHLPRIFEPFYQVGNARQDRRKGLGLGLATVRRFADQLKIDVRVSAVPEGGTCFTLRLTRADVPSGPPRAAEGAVNGAFAGRRILAVEDDPAIADALLRLLQTWGCDVLSATDGPQALALAEQMAPPDAVIADLALPGALSGVAVVQALRERWGDAVPMLFITGSTDGPVYEAAQASGLPLLVKPVAPARLRAFLAQAFSAAPGP